MSNDIKELFLNLESPDPSIRFSTLSQIESISWTEEYKQLFKEYFQCEQDTGIQFHMQKIIAKFEKQNKVSDNNEVLALLENPVKDEVNLALMLESAKRKEAPQIMDALRSANWPTFSTKILPSVLKFIKKYGTQKEVLDVEQLCKSNDTRVLITAIEALEKLSPEKLKPFIVSLLISSDFGVRSRAVRILHKWDPLEARRHFESMLFSDMTIEKQAALYHSFFFPFKEIENLMLRFISIEKDTELIKKAMLVFMANPNKQVPAKLLEVRQATVGQKKQLINTILKGVLLSLYQAKLVNAEPEQVLQILEKHFTEKRINLFINQHSNALKSSDSEVRLNSALKLVELARRGVQDVINLLKDYLLKETEQTNIAKVKHFMATGQLPNDQTEEALTVSPTRLQTKTEESILEKISTDVPLENSRIEKINAESRFSDYSDEQRISYIDSIDKENFTDKMKQVEPMLSKLTVAEQVAVIQKIESFGNQNYTDILMCYLKNENKIIMPVAINAICAINPDTLHPILPQLINHRFDEVKLVAIRIFALFDKQQAISLVEKMLTSIQPIQRRVAIFCLSNFDYHSVSKILMNAVRTETSMENIEQIFSIIISNADEEIFFELYINYKKCESEKKEAYQKICHELAIQIVTNNPEKTIHSLYKDADKRVEEEESHRKERLTYKLERIQKIRENSEHNTVFDKSLIKFTVVAYSIGAILTIIIWFTILSP